MPMMMQDEQSIHINPSWFLVVATMARYKEASDCLLDSLRKVKWPESQIIMVYGHDPSFMGVTHDYKNVTHCCLDVNLYEYNAFIGITTLNSQANNASYMLLHDTCEVGPLFTQKACNAFARFEDDESVSLGARLSWLTAVGHANICIFNGLAAKRIHEHFKGMESMDKTTAIRIELDMHDMSLKRLPIHMSKTEDHPVAYEPVAKYSSGVMRNVKYFVNLDMHKYYYYCCHPGSHPEIP